MAIVKCYTMGDAWPGNGYEIKEVEADYWRGAGRIDDVVLIDDRGYAYFSTALMTELHISQAGCPADGPYMMLGRSRFARMTESNFNRGMDHMSYPRRSDRERKVAARIEAGLTAIMDKGWVK